MPARKGADAAADVACTSLQGRARHAIARPAVAKFRRFPSELHLRLRARLRNGTCQGGSLPVRRRSQPSEAWVGFSGGDGILAGGVAALHIILVEVIMRTTRILRLAVFATIAPVLCSCVFNAVTPVNPPQPGPLPDTGSVVVPPPPVARPFTVSSGAVATGITVPAGATVHVTATGSVNFGGAVLGMGAPVLGPNGDDWATPADYPASQLRKNSLVCKIGDALYQCGFSATLRPNHGGELILLPNDKTPLDNSGEWTVLVTVTPPVTR